jgi:hypothetical protein
MRVRTFFVTFAACSLWCVAAQLSHAKGLCDDSKVIVAGKSLGALTLGMSVDDAIKIVGKPKLEDKPRQFEGSTWEKLYYFPDSDFAFYAQDGKLVEISIGGGTDDLQSCSTAEGIRLGSRKKSIQKVYGAPEKREEGGVISYWTFDKVGINFTLGTDGGVMALDIITPGLHDTVKRIEKELGSAM